MTARALIADFAVNEAQREAELSLRVVLMCITRAIKKANHCRPIRKMGNIGNIRKGVLALELVIVLPILLLVLLAVIQLSTYLLATQAIQAAALVGTREATLPGATTQSVNQAVHRALSGWRFEADMDSDAVVIEPDGWQTARSGRGVSVIVRVEAKKAAFNSLRHLPGFAWTDEEIRGLYVMRKE